MLNSLLNSDPTRFGGLGEVSLYALIGFIVVFIGIAFLIFIVWLVGRLISKTDKNITDKPEKQAKEVKKTTETDVEPIAAETEELSEEALVVITAAIIAYYQNNNPKCEFTVKRIKRI